ncbi:MAG: hypothetical protein AVDCRST_MAG65-369 [uncultured Solirubrobacteraceae bacterium]|uniref:Uncharacterized protein n=1 Tax=uncultured Solirubrobacteraceae bacterium TaxID=1162706 RepID=A0A6J4R843_9ACTN|nr:MAG: hypothetical protein AVDCRST_MAG65-369 [uncultured Solirubrobacteraceae bacterium]
MESVSCREAERGFQCRVGYPSGLELDCFMGAGEVAPGPYCSTPQGRLRTSGLA